MKLVAIVLALTALSGRCSTSVHLVQSAGPAPNSTLDYLARTLDSLQLALGFFQREHRHVNLDAIIGTRVVEASLNVLLQKLDAADLTSVVPPSAISRVQILRDLAHDVSVAATPYIKANEPDYYAKIGPIIEEGLFELDYDSRSVSKPGEIWPVNPVEAMEESESDSCLAELFGTSTNGMTCAITKNCWEKMTKFGYSGYSLTHEIFYLEIAERFGCQLEIQSMIKAHGQSSLRNLHDVFCANILFEANGIAASGFPVNLQDLFMEQAALCGMLGYRDFFNNDWLNKILSWQDRKDGCYKWDGWDKEPGQDAKMYHRRSKREEKRVTKGCLCHRTTVAASALVQYVRYILEVWLLEQV